MPDTNSSLIKLRGHLIEEDEHGNWNLNDIWSLAKAPATRLPKHWKGQKAVGRLVAEVQKKVTVDYLKENKANSPVIYARRGRGQEGTFAHPILAAAYAGYLSPKLEIETREVWLRFRSGDATLADEILQKASPEGNEWAGVRALGRSKRNEFTAVLQAHGVQGYGFANCTDAVYGGLFDATAQQIKVSKGLTKSQSLRDAMETDELVSVMFAETLSRKSIEREAPHGNSACVSATRRSASIVRQAIEDNKAPL